MIRILLRHLIILVFLLPAKYGVNSNFKVYKTNSGGNWTVKKYADGWHELYIRIIVPRASTDAYIGNFNFPDGIKLNSARTSITPSLNGWNVANFYNNSPDQSDDSMSINNVTLVFAAKTTQSLTYHFDLVVSGFLST